MDTRPLETAVVSGDVSRRRMGLHLMSPEIHDPAALYQLL